MSSDFLGVDLLPGGESGSNMNLEGADVSASQINLIE